MSTMLPAPPFLGGPHGSPRGLEQRLSRTFEGRFGRMFRSLPAAEFAELDLLALGAAMEAAPKNINEQTVDPEDNPAIPAGYTYLAQFIDHDLTFDPVSSLQRANDPEALLNFRTPRFDLDCVYGRGPADQPYLYREDGIRMVLGKVLDNGSGVRAFDLPRTDPTASQPTVLLQPPAIKDPPRAIIGDPRNDIHVIIAQMHVLFLRFHNRLANLLESRLGAPPSFSQVQQMVRWHYQWMILMDFLPKIVDAATYKDVLPHVSQTPVPNKRPPNVLDFPPNLLFYTPRSDAFLPIEFSAAAYRFGHSMVRPAYRLNRSPKFETGGPFPILGAPKGINLRGFGPITPDWPIEWDLFFDGIAPAPQPALGPGRVQSSYKIDTLLVDPLGNLTFEFARALPSLAKRNLLRGWQLQLPSGQSVARAMAVDVVADKDLKVGASGKILTDFSNAFTDNAPLWFYILAEAEQKCQGNTLGPVGSRIVMETFVGLMMEDGHSFLSQAPLWQPDPDLSSGGKFGMAEFVKAALAA